MATFKDLAVFFLDRRAQSSNWNRANPGLLPPNVEVSTQGRAGDGGGGVWTSGMLPLLQVVSAERGESAGSGRIGGDRVDFKLEVVPSLTNSGGSLHGGAQATLVDTLTTTALSAARRTRTCWRGTARSSRGTGGPRHCGWTTWTAADQARPSTSARPWTGSAARCASSRQRYTMLERVEGGRYCRRAATSRRSAGAGERRLRSPSCRL